MSGKRHFFEKRRDGGSLATLVMKSVTGNGQRCVMRDQSCGFEMAVPVAVRAPEALAIGGKRRAAVEPRHRPTFQVTTQVLRCRSTCREISTEEVSYFYQQLADLWGVPTTNARAVRPRHRKLSVP